MKHGSTSQMRRRRKAFTLIELLGVMAIVLILAGLVVVAARYALLKSRIAKVESQIAWFCQKAEKYYAEQGFYPANDYPGWYDGLGAAVGYHTNGSSVLGIWPDNREAVDPWDVLLGYYAYDIPAGTYTQRQEYFIASAGPDRKFGTSDDIKKGNSSRALQ